MKYKNLKKPVGNRVEDMVIMAGTVRARPTGQGGFVNTATWMYPQDHPMRGYRDAKKEARRARNG